MTTMHPDSFYDHHEGAKVSRSLFMQRIARAESRGILDEKVKLDALTSSPKQYRAKYGARQTNCIINGENINLYLAYKAILNPTVIYEVFRARLKSFSEKQRRLKFVIDKSASANAASYSQSDWVAFIGSGKSRRFIYDEKRYSEHLGRTFPSTSHFLKIIGESDKLGLVQDRLKQGWGLDEAIFLPKLVPKDGRGRVYIIRSDKTPLVYIGATTLTVEERLSFHRVETKAGGTRKLCQAMREFGQESFKIKELELIEDIGCEGRLDFLKQRERHYIKFYNSRHPLGLNDTAGGELTVRRGIETTHNGVVYPSISAWSRAVEEYTDGLVPSYCAASRLRAGKEIPDKTRKHSKHPDAGSNLFRRYLGLLRRKSLAPIWYDYDMFKRDVLRHITIEAIVSRKLKLKRLIPTLKYGPDNFRWVTNGRKAL
jgi:hypothetical protein